MFYTIATYALYAAAIAPLVLVKQSFFPFIAYKALFFRSAILIGILFFLLHLITHLRDHAYLAAIVQRLKHPFVLCASIFGAMITLTAALGVNPAQSFWSNFERGDGALQILHYIAFFLLAVLLTTDRKKLHRLLALNIIVSVPMCLYALLQLVTHDPSNWFVIAIGDRVSGTLGNPSYLAAYLIFILTFILYFLLQKKNPWKITLSVIFLFEFFILLKTGTRGAFLGVLAAGIIFAVLEALRTENKKIRYALWGSTAGAILLIGVFFATHTAPLWTHVPVLNRLVNLTSAVNDIKPRVWTWGSATAGFLERPIAGWGIENFAVPFDKYYNPGHFGVESFFDRTHNVFLEYAIAGGLLVLVPWLALFFFYFKRLARRERSRWRTVLFVTPIAYLVQGFFLFDTLPIYVGLFVFLTLFIATEQELPDEESIPHGKLEGVNIGTAIVLTIGMAGILYSTIVLPVRKNIALVEALTLQNRMIAELNAQQQTAISPVDVANAFERALSVQSPIGQEETIGMYQKFMLDMVETIAANPRLAQNQEIGKEFLRLVLRMNDIYDANTSLFTGLKQRYINGGINLRFGFTFGVKELIDRGKRLFNEGIAIAPTRMEFIRVLLEVARIEKDTDVILKLGARAHLYRPDLFPAATSTAH